VRCNGVGEHEDPDELLWARVRRGDCPEGAECHVTLRGLLEAVLRARGVKLGGPGGVTPAPALALLIEEVVAHEDEAESVWGPFRRAWQGRASDGVPEPT
jgi:hypothetical protein